MTDDIKSEHERLLEKTLELEREHGRLQEHPDDIAGHREHSARLRKQIEDLHAHIRRLRGEPPPEAPDALPPEEASAWDGQYEAMVRSIARAEHDDLLRRARMVRNFASSLCTSSQHMRLRNTLARLG